MTHTRLGLALLALLTIGTAARADTVILVTASVGPNAFNSPNYEGYRDNAYTALATGGSSAGVPGTPAFYQALPAGAPVPITDLVVTDFPSWRGVANPGDAFGSAFAAETGTRLYFGLTILPVVGTPRTPFSISQLSFSATSTDPLQTLDFGFPTGSYEYSDDFVGLVLNPDGSVGQRITSGPSTQLVDALISRGSSNAFEILSSDPGATDQDKIDGLPRRDFRYTGTYSLGDRSGSADVNVTATPIPAPPSVVVAGAGLAVLVMRRFRRAGGQ